MDERTLWLIERITCCRNYFSDYTHIHCKCAHLYACQTLAVGVTMFTSHYDFFKRSAFSLLESTDLRNKNSPHFIILFYNLELRERRYLNLSVAIHLIIEEVPNVTSL